MSPVEAERIARGINAVQTSYHAEVIMTHPNQGRCLIGCYDERTTLCRYRDGETLYDPGQQGELLVIEEWQWRAIEWLRQVIAAEVYAEHELNEREQQGA